MLLVPFVYRNWVVLSVECGCYESEGALLVLLERYQVYGVLQVVFGWNLIAIQTWGFFLSFRSDVESLCADQKGNFLLSTGCYIDNLKLLISILSDNHLGVFIELLSVCECVDNLFFTYIYIMD